VRLTESRNARSKQVTSDAYRAANRLRMAARRALEWIGMFRKAWLVFRYEVCDLFLYSTRSSYAHIVLYFYLEASQALSSEHTIALPFCMVMEFNVVNRFVFSLRGLICIYCYSNRFLAGGIFL